MRARARPARRSRARLCLDTAVVAASLFLLPPPVALARPTASRPTHARPDVCRQTVFAGLASDCNLSGGGSEPACCATLRDAERRRCFCSQELVDVVAAVIGEEGLDFFRQFARARCSTRLTEREACSLAPASGALFATQVGLAPPAADYEYESDDDDATRTPPATPGFGTPGLPPVAPARLDARGGVSRVRRCPRARCAAGAPRSDARAPRCAVQVMTTRVRDLNDVGTRRGKNDA